MSMATARGAWMMFAAAAAAELVWLGVLGWLAWRS